MNIYHLPQEAYTVSSGHLRVKGEFNAGRGVEVSLESKQGLELSLMTAKKGTPG